MTKTITVNNKPLQIKEYNGQRVVTFKDIDACHNRAEGTARKRFNDNKQHFIKDEDYYIVTPKDLETRMNTELSEKRTFGIEINSPRGIVLITESGYLMLVKSFTDKLAWEVQRQLVNTYLKYREVTKKVTEKVPDSVDEPKNIPTAPPQILPLNCGYFNKTWNGEPVVFVRDMTKLFDIPASIIYAFIKDGMAENEDYRNLKGVELAHFKSENTHIHLPVKHLYVITRKGFIKFCHAYGVQVNVPKCMLAQNENKTNALATTQITTTAMSTKEKTKIISDKAEYIKKEITAIEVLLNSLDNTLSVSFKDEIMKSLDYLSLETRTNIFQLLSVRNR